MTAEQRRIVDWYVRRGYRENHLAYGRRPLVRAASGETVSIELDGPMRETTPGMDPDGTSPWARWLNQHWSVEDQLRAAGVTGHQRWYCDAYGGARCTFEGIEVRSRGSNDHAVIWVPRIAEALYADPRTAYLVERREIRPGIVDWLLDARAWLAPKGRKETYASLLDAMGLGPVEPGEGWHRLDGVIVPSWVTRSDREWLAAMQGAWRGSAWLPGSSLGPGLTRWPPHSAGEPPSRLEWESWLISEGISPPGGAVDPPDDPEEPDKPTDPPSDLEAMLRRIEKLLEERLPRELPNYADVGLARLDVAIRTRALWVDRRLEGGGPLRRSLKSIWQGHRQAWLVVAWYFAVVYRRLIYGVVPTEEEIRWRMGLEAGLR